MVVEELGEKVELAGLCAVYSEGCTVGVGWRGGGGGTGRGEAVLAGEVEAVGLLAHDGVLRCRIYGLRVLCWSS